jgi:hypothetical protein
VLQNEEIVRFEIKGLMPLSYILSFDAFLFASPNRRQPAAKSSTSDQQYSLSSF